MCLLEKDLDVSSVEVPSGRLDFTFCLPQIVCRVCVTIAIHRMMGIHVGEAVKVALQTVQRSDGIHHDTAISMEALAESRTDLEVSRPFQSQLPVSLEQGVENSWHCHVAPSRIVHTARQ
jgi:hypothetical protein